MLFSQSKFKLTQFWNNRELSAISESYWKVPIIVIYTIIEISLFFGCQKYNWPCTATFRIIFVIHDFGYFLTYAAVAGTSYYKRYKKDCDYCKANYDCDPDDYYYCTRVKEYQMDIASCVCFLITFAIGITILVIYAQFSKSGCSCCCCCQPEPEIILANGQMIQMQTVGQTVPVVNQQLYFPQNQINPALVQQPQLVQQVVMQPTQPALVSMPIDQSPSTTILKWFILNKSNANNTIIYFQNDFYRQKKKSTYMYRNFILVLFKSVWFSKFIQTRIWRFIHCLLVPYHAFWRQKSNSQWDKTRLILKW